MRDWLYITTLYALALLVASACGAQTTELQWEYPTARWGDDWCDGEDFSRHLDGHTVCAWNCAFSPEYPKLAQPCGEPQAIVVWLGESGVSQVGYSCDCSRGWREWFEPPRMGVSK